MNSKEHGFTLIEYLIASLLMLIIILFAFGFLSRAHARLDELAEAEELEHRRSVVADNLRHDFEQAGMHVLMPQLRVNSQEAVYFATTPHYQTEVLGRCRKLTNDPSARTTAARGLYASGWLQFKPQQTGAGIIGFLGQDDSITALQFVPHEATGGGELRYYHQIAGAVVANTSIDSAHLPGDYYRLLIEGAKPQITVKVYRIKQAQEPKLLVTHNGQAARYPYRPLAELARDGAEIYNVMLSGSANALIQTGPALLPVDTAVGTTRLPSVVNISAPGGAFESVSLLQGDINVDIVRTQEDVDYTFASNGAQALRIKSPCNGQYRVGDVVMLIDDVGQQQQRTALFRVVTPTPMAHCGAFVTLMLDRIPSERPAWQRLHSRIEDYDHEFRGLVTQLVKVLPPVTYRLDVANGQLLRREGGREDIVAGGIVDFLVTKREEQAVTVYEVKCELRREEVATAAGGMAAGHTTVSLILSPWALSQRYEYQKLGPSLD